MRPTLRPEGTNAEFDEYGWRLLQLDVERLYRNQLSGGDWTDLTDGGDTSLHTHDDRYLQLTGGTMAGDIDMDGHNVEDAGNVYVQSGGLTGVNGGARWVYSTGPVTLTAPVGNVNIQSGVLNVGVNDSQVGALVLWGSGSGSAGGTLELYLGAAHDIPSTLERYAIEVDTTSLLFRQDGTVLLTARYGSPSDWLFGVDVSMSTHTISFFDANVSISGAVDSIGSLQADGYWRVGTGTTGHSLGANGDFLVSGQMEVDGVTWFDQDIDLASGIDIRIAENLFIRGNTTLDQIAFGSGPQLGRQFVFTQSGFLTRDFDHPVQTNPTAFIHDASDPDLSNNKHGHIYHDGTGFVVASGANTGAGSSPATIDNYLMFSPRGTEGLRVTGDGDVQLVATKAIYFGDNATNGSWRLMRSGDDFVFERRESGSWVTKSTITA